MSIINFAVHHISIQADSSLDSCTSCPFWGVELRALETGLCLLTGHEISLDASTDLKRMDDCPIEIREPAHQLPTENPNMIMIPCAPNAKVYTISEKYYPCSTCRYGSGVRHGDYMQRQRCLKKNRHCPLSIIENVAEGFEVRKNEEGDTWVLSNPGEVWSDGLEEFGGLGGIVYYSREEAEKVIADLERESGEHQG